MHHAIKNLQISHVLTVAIEGDRPKMSNSVSGTGFDTR